MINIDSLLSECMPVLGQKMAEAMPRDAQIDYQFSEEFQRKMRVLKKRAVQQEKYGIPVESWKRAAASVCVVLSGILMASLGVEAIRTEIYEYIQREYSKYNIVEYRIIKNETVEFVPLYPTYIPEGYTMNIYDEDHESLYLHYINETGGSFSIQQQEITDGLRISEDNEYVHQRTVEVLWNDAVLCLKENGTSHVRWRTDTTWYCVIATKFIGEDEILRICNSLEATDK